MARDVQFWISRLLGGRGVVCPMRMAILILTLGALTLGVAGPTWAQCDIEIELQRGPGGNADHRRAAGRRPCPCDRFGPGDEHFVECEVECEVE